MKQFLYLKIPLNFLEENDILEYFEKVSTSQCPPRHILSVNTENLMTALENKEFREVVIKAHNHIADGSGIVAAARFLYGIHLPQLTGVDMMDALIREASKRRLTVLLIGGKGNLAEMVANCYRESMGSFKIIQTHGFTDISNPLESEEKTIFDIVRTTKPHLVFVSFGSPWQEIWIERHKSKFGSSIIMGVGGAFSFLAGVSPRAPVFMRRLGMEWLFRLIKEPWRAQRQIKLIRFLLLVLKEKLMHAV